MDYSLLIDINNRQIFTYEIDADQVRTLLKDEVIDNLFTQYPHIPSLSWIYYSF